MESCFWETLGLKTPSTVPYTNGSREEALLSLSQSRHCEEHCGVACLCFPHGVHTKGTPSSWSLLMTCQNGVPNKQAMKFPSLTPKMFHGLFLVFTWRLHVQKLKQPPREQETVCGDHDPAKDINH